MSTPSQVPQLPEHSDDHGTGQALVPAEEIDIFSLLPMPHMELTDSQKQEVQRHQLSRLVMGPVAAAVMVCPDNPTQAPTTGVTLQSLYDKQRRCPHAKSCPLLAQDTAPHGRPCPLETNYIPERFLRWTNDFGKNPSTLNETERVSISTLVSLDLQEQRCLDILGEAEAARLTDISIKEIAQNGDPIAYEKVIHQNQQLLVSLTAQRRTILRDFELTPEMQTKKKKYDQGSRGLDLSTEQSARADKFRRATVIEVE